MARETDSVRRRIAFDAETWTALDRLAKDRMVTLQELAEEAFRSTFDHDALRSSEAFRDPERLLAECDRRGLEGLVCKERDVVYHSGTKSRGQDRDPARGQPE